MKCSNCGREFEGNFCPRCGHPARPPQQREENMIINLLQPLSLIFNTAGLCRSKALKNGKGLATAGLVISILYIL